MITTMAIRRPKQADRQAGKQEAPLPPSLSPRASPQLRLQTGPLSPERDGIRAILVRPVDSDGGDGSRGLNFGILRLSSLLSLHRAPSRSRTRSPSTFPLALAQASLGTACGVGTE
ncbi:hypothetical protein ALC56_08357 [Trachymyrmex septentrionalis]|uniref:Uncharacterized protein n=1 Tax=Trachymyrmex septentrionalis TaxID=34720 RepID=A0A195F9L9_9HYME|nr:hypothetical protein ALC56_08357 [Trachymyrmex septentrionalis]